MTDEGQVEVEERAIWTAAYVRGLSLATPDEAVDLAEQAVDLYYRRWAEGGERGAQLG